MAWLDNILGTSIDETMDDKDVCLNMLSASKGSIAMLAAAITETTNPQFRQFLTTELTSAINSHFALSDMAIQKDGIMHLELQKTRSWKFQMICKI